MSTTKKKQDQQPFSSLSSIVSNLVRAAIGGNHQDVPDGDLDKYVADMIMKSTNTPKSQTTLGPEAHYSPDGSTSASSVDKAQLASGVIVNRSDSNGLKTNKRFLSSIIKSTDDHNQALIRAEEKKAADMAKELIAELDRRAAERKQGFQGRESRRYGKSSLGRMRMDEIESRSRSTSPVKHRSRARSSSPASVAQNEVKVRGRGTRKYEANQTSSSSSGSRLGLKMDKYFEEGYDPRLDTHSGDEAETQVKRKRSEKDHQHSSSKSRSQRKHRKHKSGRSSRSGRQSDSDSEENESKNSKHHRTEHHGSESQRRRHHDGSPGDERDKSRSSRSNSKYNHSSNRTPSRSPSPKRARRRKDSGRSERVGKEERSDRERHLSTRRTYSDHSDQEHGGAAHYRRKRSRSKSRSRSHSRTPPPPIPTQPKPASREWDLHKINKNAVRAHLHNINRTNPS